jgi:RNA polymerase sigma factor (sigma-70 family)
MNKLLSKNSEEEIIQKIVDGETALFEILIRKYNSLLYKIARGYGFDHEEAKDLLQETHIAAYQNLKKFEARSAYKTWIAKIMVNKCLYKLSYGSSKYEVSHQIVDENSQPMFSSKKQTTEADQCSRNGRNAEPYCRECKSKTEPCKNLIAKRIGNTLFKSPVVRFQSYLL